MTHSAAKTDSDSSQYISSDRKLVVIQRNPTSGSGKGRRDLLDLIRELRLAGFRVRLFANRDRLDAFLKQDSILTQIRCLVAAGGDGTVGGLVNRHPDLPIATLPLGTENLVARHLQIKRCGKTLAKLIHTGRIRKFDTGQANGQTFLLMASVGIDADVVRRLDETRSGNIQHLSYVKPIFASFTKYKFPKLTVHSPDGKLLAEGSHIIATNIPEYGFRMQFAPAADPHDGQLDVRVFRRSGMIATLAHAIRTRLGWKDHAPDIQRFQLQEFQIRSTQDSTPGQIDGDPAESCPLQISVQPASMTLLVSDQP